MAQTDGTGDSVDIGVSLSGGGHRATLFGLGVLLYLAHAHDERDVPLSRRVSAISSVSGGSITNGFLARSLDYRSAEADQVEAAAQILTMQLAEHGTLFARRRVKAYAVSLVGLATLGLLGLAAGLTLRTGGWIVIALASILVLLLAALAAQARGRVCEWALADALFSDRTGHRYPLSIMTRSTRHIICATEIQTGQAMWFTAKGAVSRAFTLSDEPGDLSLARAVQASACLPVAFPPRRLRAQPTRLLEANWPRGARLPTRAVVVDGGVRDNLGVDVFLAWGKRSRLVRSRTSATSSSSAARRPASSARGSGVTSRSWARCSPCASSATCPTALAKRTRVGLSSGASEPHRTSSHRVGRGCEGHSCI